MGGYGNPGRAEPTPAFHEETPSEKATKDGEGWEMRRRRAGRKARGGEMLGGRDDSEVALEGSGDERALVVKRAALERIGCEGSARRQSECSRKGRDDLRRGNEAKKSQKMSVSTSGDSTFFLSKNLEERKERRENRYVSCQAPRATLWPQGRRAKLHRAQLEDFRNQNDKLSSKCHANDHK